jgi:F-type H+-transporting ATPase subunit b
MDEILNQLGALVLGSVPTIIFFIALVVAYTTLVHKPLHRVLAERRARTTGAVANASAAIAAADANTRKYEDALRSARTQVYEVREQRMKRWTVEREAAVASAREAAQARVKTARAEIETSAIAARAQVQAGAAQLSAQILKAVLPAGMAGGR